MSAAAFSSSITPKQYHSRRVLRKGAGAGTAARIPAGDCPSPAGTPPRPSPPEPPWLYGEAIPPIPPAPSETLVMRGMGAPCPPGRKEARDEARGVMPTPAPEWRSAQALGGGIIRSVEPTCAGGDYGMGEAEGAEWVAGCKGIGPKKEGAM